MTNNLNLKKGQRLQQNKLRFNSEMKFQKASLLRKKCFIVKQKSSKPLYKSIYDTNHDNQLTTLILIKIVVPKC